MQIVRGLLGRRSVIARLMWASAVENEMDRGGLLATAFKSSLAASLGPQMRMAEDFLLSMCQQIHWVSYGLLWIVLSYALGGAVGQSCATIAKRQFPRARILHVTKMQPELTSVPSSI